MLKNKVKVFKNKIKMYKTKRFLKHIVNTLRAGISNAWVVVSGRRKKTNVYLRQVRNQYAGKRCFVIGNGPSLTKEDLEMLKDEVTFASNRIFRIFPQTSWRPTYFVISDPNVARSEGVIDNVNQMQCAMKFTSAESYWACRGIKEPFCCVHSWWKPGETGFSRDLCKGFYAMATVTYFMIQIAVWMGFKEIYLLGIDNRYAVSIGKDGKVTVNQNVKSYFSGMDQGIQTMHAATWEMDAAYEYLEKYSRGSDFRVYNATRGGCLEKFERVDFDSLF